jgi:hypothetical protein
MQVILHILELLPLCVEFIFEFLNSVLYFLSPLSLPLGLLVGLGDPVLVLAVILALLLGLHHQLLLLSLYLGLHLRDHHVLVV